MSVPPKTRLANKQGVSKENDDQKRATACSATSISPDAASIENEKLATISLLEEMKKLRQENIQGHNHTKESLNRLEKTMTDIKEQIADHQQRIGELEGRVNSTEDRGAKHHRVLRYLLQRERQHSAECEELQNRMRRNNLRIYQIPEGSEVGNMAVFVKDLLPKVLTLPAGLDINIERAHRSLQSRPTSSTAPPRSILVRFLDAAVKDVVLQQAWRQGKVTFKDKRIFFDQDYSPELQKKRSKVHSVVKQLKQKNIQAKCLYPARLKIKLDSGEKTFATLISASDTLEKLGVQVTVGERERIEEKLAEEWISRRRSENDTLFMADLKAMVEE
uniref:L1 transposable element RRM domain-containing protein n=1 Tax=Oryzias sinensis TaxID=183150 RepID=A0A8C7WUI1_9TELE